MRRVFLAGVSLLTGLALVGPMAVVASAAPQANPGRAVSPSGRYLQRVATGDPVVFLTVDDGVTEDPSFLALVRAEHIPVTVFLTAQMARGARLGYFQQLAAAGAVIENHTLTHRDLRRVSAATFRSQVCAVSDQYAAQFGYRPQLLRPPYGDWNSTVIARAHGCGIAAVVGWDAVLPQYGRLQTWNRRGILHPGDIVLLHFRPGMTAQVRRLQAVLTAQHLRLALLEDYL